MTGIGIFGSNKDKDIKRTSPVGSAERLRFSRLVVDFEFYYWYAETYRDNYGILKQNLPKNLVFSKYFQILARKWIN